jgi:hypothetical protein
MFRLVNPLFGRFTDNNRPPRTGSTRGLSEVDIAGLARYAEGLSEILGEHAGPAIGSILAAASRLDRTRLLSEWATSRRSGLRVALARAFSVPFDAVGRSTAMRVLALDPSTEVRRALAIISLARNAPPVSSVAFRALAAGGQTLPA